MDILILNWKDIKNPEVGGAEIIAFEFARRLVKDGHAVTFFSRSFNGGRREESMDGVKIVRRGNKFSVYIHAFFYYLSLKQKPDRVVDMINTLCWQTPLYVPKEKRIAYVNQLAKEVLFYELPFPFSFLAYLFERIEYLPYRNTRFLCYSQSTKDDLIDFGIQAKKIQLFPLGLDHARYKKQQKKSENPSFVFVARLVRMKRGDLCIQAMKRVVKRYPKATLAIVGNGPDEERLFDLIVQYKLTENVKIVNKNNFFIDKNPIDVKIMLMQTAWALLLPSVKEGWGMVVTEAAACGTPSVVTDVTGLKDSVIPNKTGIVLSRNPTPDEMADALLKIIEDKSLRERLSREAVFWSKHFSWEKSYSEFKALLLSN